jgi:hypothetical protein
MLWWGIIEIYKLPLKEKMMNKIIQQLNLDEDFLFAKVMLNVLKCPRSKKKPLLSGKY